MWNTDKSSIASSAIFLKEPIEKRRRLTRFYTSLATATFFTKRERGDGGNSGQAIRTIFKNDKTYSSCKKLYQFTHQHFSIGENNMTKNHR